MTKPTLNEVPCPRCGGPCEDTQRKRSIHAKKMEGQYVEYAEKTAVELDRIGAEHAEKMAAVRKGSLNLIAENGKLKRDFARTKAVIEAARAVNNLTEDFATNHEMYGGHERALFKKLRAALAALDKEGSPT